MKKYTVAYRLWECAKEQTIEVFAHNKEEAYEKADFEAIPEKHGEFPYAAWVESVTYDNGKVKTFNTFEGKPY